MKKAVIVAVVELRKIPNLGSIWIQSWVSIRLKQNCKAGFEAGFPLESETWSQGSKQIRS